MTVADLVRDLQATQAPNALVRVVGEVTCDSEDHPGGYASVEVTLRVENVRSRCGVVVLEGREV